MFNLIVWETCGFLLILVFEESDRYTGTEGHCKTASSRKI